MVKRTDFVDVHVNVRLLSVLRMPSEPLIGAAGPVVRLEVPCRGNPSVRVPLTATEKAARRLRLGALYERSLRRVLAPVVVVFAAAAFVGVVSSLVAGDSGLVNAIFLGVGVGAALLIGWLVVGLLIYLPSHPVLLSDADVLLRQVNRSAATEWQLINPASSVEFASRPKQPGPADSR